MQMLFFRDMFRDVFRYFLLFKFLHVLVTLDPHRVFISRLAQALIASDLCCVLPFGQNIIHLWIGICTLIGALSRWLSLANTLVDNLKKQCDEDLFKITTRIPPALRLVKWPAPPRGTRARAPPQAAQT